jgi:hypothetical protein
MLRCLLCAETQPSAQHEWCAVAESLVCSECCEALLAGDPHRLFSLAANAGRVMTPEVIFHACALCERGRRQAACEMLRDSETDEAPAC